MDPVRLGEHRDIDPVVYDENRAALAAHIGHGACDCEKIAPARVLEPQLHDSRAGVEQGFCEHNRLVSAGRVDHRVKVRGQPRHADGNLVSTILWSVIFLRSVLRLSPSIRAARTWLPPARLSASSTSGRSISATSRWYRSRGSSPPGESNHPAIRTEMISPSDAPSAVATAPVLAPPGRESSISSPRIVDPGASSAARMTAFSSSRTLPGHSADSSLTRASGLMVLARAPISWTALETK